MKDLEVGHSEQKKGVAEEVLVLALVLLVLFIWAGPIAAAAFLPVDSWPVLSGTHPSRTISMI